MAYEVSNGNAADAAPVYSVPARRFHWWTALLVAVMIPLGYIMSDDANPFKFTDATFGRLKSTHMLIGFSILWLVVARLVYRYRHGAPPSVSTLTPVEKGASHATHWLLYLLLIAMPLGGWIGASMYDDRAIFGLFNLPQIARVNKELSDTVFMLHGYGAWAIVLLAGLHIGAALFHYFVKKDGVLRRMLPRLGGGE